MANNNLTRVISIICFIALFAFLAWYFFDIVIYMFLALVFTFVGAPLVKLLSKIKIKKRRMPRSLAAGVVLILLISLIGLFISLFIPIVVRELTVLASIDPALITSTFSEWLAKGDTLLKDYGILSKDENLAIMAVDYLRRFVAKLDLGNIFGGTVHLIATIFIGIFAVVFMTYFSLKDNRIFVNLIKRFIPLNFRGSFDRILSATKKQLVRYFSGVFMEMLIMGIIEGLLAFALGLPNPILIGFIGGLLNIIPYLGPWMGAVIAIILSITAIIPLEPTQMMFIMTTLKVIIIFVAANIIDNFVLQPTIYGKSVKAHPLEIFIVILCASKVGGVLGMILAVPVYSLVRIIVREYFGQYYYRSEPAPATPEMTPLEENTKK